MSSPKFYIWPHYALEVGGKRVTLPLVAGAVIARLFHSRGHFVDTAELIEAAYHDDPEGGPLTARDCIKVSLLRVRDDLERIGARVEGWTKVGRFRLILDRDPDTQRLGEADLFPTGNGGPYRYVAAYHQPSPKPQMSSTC